MATTPSPYPCLPVYGEKVTPPYIYISPPCIIPLCIPPPLMHPHFYVSPPYINLRPMHVPHISLSDLCIGEKRRKIPRSQSHIGGTYTCLRRNKRGKYIGKIHRGKILRYLDIGLRVNETERVRTRVRVYA